MVQVALGGSLTITNLTSGAISLIAADVVASEEEGEVGLQGEAVTLAEETRSRIMIRGSIKDSAAIRASPRPPEVVVRSTEVAEGEDL